MKVLPEGFKRLTVVWLICLTSCIVNVWLKFESRQSISELHAYYEERDYLHSQWSKLLIEKNSLIEFNTLKLFAEKNDLVSPSLSHVEFIDSERSQVVNSFNAP